MYLASVVTKARDCFIAKVSAAQGFEQESSMCQLPDCRSVVVKG
jgi:hypothetical protein